MSKGDWKSKNSNRFFITRKGEFMNTIQTESTDNKKTKVIQKEIGNTKYTVVTIFCKKNGKELKDKMKSIIKQEVMKNNN